MEADETKTKIGNDFYESGIDNSSKKIETENVFAKTTMQNGPEFYNKKT